MCFKKSWLSSGGVDSNEDILSNWCSEAKSDTFSAHCKVCSKTFTIANMCLAQILSHAQSQKHKKNMKTQIGQTQFKIDASIPGLPSDHLMEPQLASLTAM